MKIMIQAVADGKLWAIERTVFQQIMQSTGMKKIENQVRIVIIIVIVVVVTVITVIIIVIPGQLPSDRATALQLPREHPLKNQVSFITRLQVLIIASCRCTFESLFCI